MLKIHVVYLFLSGALTHGTCAIPEGQGTGIMGPAANDFMIARNIVELLYEK